MIDRRRLFQLGLGAGVSLGVPGLALAKAHRGRHGAHHIHHRRGVARHDPVPLAEVEQFHLAPLATSAPRAVSFKNLHTDETLEAVYWDRGDYVPDALEAVNKVLRDFRTGEVHPIEPRLLDVLADLRASSGSTAPFQVVSGYRSPATNAVLREQSAEVAKHSLHMDGQAIDLYLDDVALDRLHDAAMDLSRGGVGYYPATGFIHVDVGPVRHWQGA